MAMSVMTLMTAVCRRRAKRRDPPGAVASRRARCPACWARWRSNSVSQQLPLELPFTDEAGKAVKLGDYFGRKPVVLAFVYYECPMLCTQVLNGLESSLRVIDESVGKEFDVVTVSFDPRETPVLAAAKKQAYLDRYKRPEAAQGWHFLTGSQASIDALTKPAGFSYVWDEQSQQFAHAERHHRGDARGQAVALLLRHRLLAARRQVRAD